MIFSRLITKSNSQKKMVQLGLDVNFMTLIILNLEFSSYFLNSI